MTAPQESDLVMNGVLPIWIKDHVRSHSGARAYSSEILARVNEKLKEKLFALTHDSSDFCIVYPVSSGCRFILFLRVRFADVEKEMGAYADRTLAEVETEAARLSRASRLEQTENEANQPPLRMPASDTPAAGAPVAPPSGAAGR